MTQGTGISGETRATGYEKLIQIGKENLGETEVRGRIHSTLIIVRLVMTKMARARILRANLRARVTAVVVDVEGEQEIGSPIKGRGRIEIARVL